MQTNPVCWFEIYVQDLPRAKLFYENILQTTLEKLETPEGLNPPCQMFAFPMDKGSTGSAGALIKMEGCASGGCGTLVYFTCQDVSDVVARVVQAGGSVFRDKFSIGQYGYIALINDTEGNMIGLHSLQ